MSNLATSNPTVPFPDSAGRRPRVALRRTGAVLAGLLAVVVLSVATDALLHLTGVLPPLGRSVADGLFALATAYRIAYGVAGGYVTARLAPDRPVGHALLLGCVGLVISLAGAVAAWNRPDLGPRWYPLALVAIAVPCSWAGGWLGRRAG